jgi:phosphoglucosamine mutase
MISASHNAFEDNGIKLFGPDGYKLSDEVEQAIEDLMDNGHGEDPIPPLLLGRAQRLDDAPGRYIEFVKNTVPGGLTLDGLRVVVDCAHGAAYKVAPTVLWELGAEVIPIGVEPDGFNINKDCGSTSTERMQEQVRARKADVGIALDGDADRVIMADENGDVVDGDQLMACIAESWHRQGRLRGGGVVATVMSNMGLEKYLERQGLALARTSVGDRYVVEHMRDHGFNMGGEQSGHIILSDYSTTGDGLIAALEVLCVLAETKRPASEVCRTFRPYPQLLQNVRFGNGATPLDDAGVQAAIGNAERKLGDRGRVVIRESGTEPLIRVMAEGEDAALVRDVVAEIVGAVEHAAG